MVDTTSILDMVKQDIAAAENRSRINSSADKWWINMLAVVKLRQKGTTMVSKLPRGVFRHILEYKFPNEFVIRYSDPYMPLKGKQDRHFPSIEKLDYNNYLVALNEISNFEYQFIFRDGTCCATKGTSNNWSRLDSKQPQAQITKIEIGYYPGTQILTGLKFYAKDGAIVLQTGYDWVADSDFKTHTVDLSDGERVIGFKSRTFNPNWAYHCDF